MHHVSSVFSELALIHTEGSSHVVPGQSDNSVAISAQKQPVLRTFSAMEYHISCHDGTANRLLWAACLAAFYSTPVKTV